MGPGSNLFPGQSLGRARMATVVLRHVSSQKPPRYLKVTTLSQLSSQHILRIHRGPHQPCEMVSEQNRGKGGRCRRQWLSESKGTCIQGCVWEELQMSTYVVYWTHICAQDSLVSALSSLGTKDLVKGEGKNTYKCNIASPSPILRASAPATCN